MEWYWVVLIAYGMYMAGWVTSALLGSAHRADEEAHDMYMRSKSEALRHRGTK